MSKQVRYRGRLSQIGIYLGKLLRMFIYQNDWKVLPMSAVIAGAVTFAVGNNIFKTQEGTLSGCFSLVCVCIWNGFFNSIQVVCRERAIIKREHRAGMHITSYIAAHMIYQMMLCILQTAILIFICSVAKMKFPEQGLVTGNFFLDLGISMFLITYAADMMSLAISSLVRNTTTAMTLMPFMMMFQLVFSGGLIHLEGAAAHLTKFTIAKWGLENLCALGNFNSQPMVTLWNTIWKFRAMNIEGYEPVKEFTDMILRENRLNEFLQESGSYTQVAAYAFEPSTVLNCWKYLILFAMIFAAAAVLLLQNVDRDKR
ncbi:MAG: ABC transporter permease [Erysipelotrichaceae bacterium]|nr:ABC transporter permease [Erysipelotrichaceae bacterium]